MSGAALLVLNIPVGTLRSDSQRRQKRLLEDEGQLLGGVSASDERFGKRFLEAQERLPAIVGRCFARFRFVDG